jgi:pyridoxine kinase
MNQQKRVLAIHDISGVGKCSLTVALPIISAAGVETSVLPTAILSTHTGGFTGFTYRDLTDDIDPIVKHWQSLDLRFDGIYTGFLGSFQQIELVGQAFEKLKSKDTLILVDPVMADDGELYKIFTPEFPKEMRKLCQKADIIIPNITETCLLTGEPYKPGPYTRTYIENLFAKLAALGVPKIVITGVHFDDRELGAACHDAKTQKTDYAFGERIEGYFHGTGDVFGSVLMGALMNGKNLHAASQVAVEFTVASIKRTKAAGTEKRYGVNFEAGLPKLAQMLGLI